MFVGWTGKVEEKCRIFQEISRKAASMTVPTAPPPKPFNKIHKQIKTREDYRGAFEEEFWETFPKNNLPSKHESWICADTLEAEAKKVGYNTKELAKTLKWIRDGVELGCSGDSRKATSMPNMTSAYEYGERVTDAIAEWVHSGIAAGPFTRQELEAEGLKEIKINPIQVRLKPNGKARIILDLSAPHFDEEQPPGTPLSVNSGIKKEDYPAKMSNTASILETLDKVGAPAEFAKIDWQSAYKHFAVKKEDWCLQFIEWGGRLFLELKSTFGASSSPGVFDVCSNVPKDIAIKISKMKKENVMKCLDDVAPIDRVGTGRVGKFSREYKKLCSKVGIRLAIEDESDKNKCFETSQVGVILGVHYDLVQWKWKIPDEKAGIICDQLTRVMEDKEVEVGLLESLAGRINHYCKIIWNGEWERAFMVGLTSANMRKGRKMTINPWTREQAAWWRRAITIGTLGTRIPRTIMFHDISVINIHCDAASEDEDSGMGGVIDAGKQTVWVSMKWPSWITKGNKNNLGDSFNRKLTTLEGLGCLIMICSAPELLKNRTIRIHCDNIGMVFAYRKKRSTCKYVSTITKAIHDVVSSLNARVDLVKARRCSSKLEVVADLLSKSKIDEAEELVELPSDRRRGVPATISKWLMNPFPSRSFGWRIAEELDRRVGVLMWEKPWRTGKRLKH